MPFIWVGPTHTLVVVFFIESWRVFSSWHWRAGSWVLSIYPSLPPSLSLVSISLLRFGSRGIMAVHTAAMDVSGFVAMISFICTHKWRRFTGSQTPICQIVCISDQMFVHAMIRPEVPRREMSASCGKSAKHTNIITRGYTRKGVCVLERGGLGQGWWVPSRSGKKTKELLLDPSVYFLRPENPNQQQTIVMLLIT